MLKLIKMTFLRFQINFFLEGREPSNFGRGDERKLSMKHRNLGEADERYVLYSIVAYPMSKALYPVTSNSTDRACDTLSLVFHAVSLLTFDLSAQTRI